MKISTIPSKIIIRIAKNSMDGSRSQNRDRTRAVEFPATADIIKEITWEPKKTSGDTPQSPEADSRPIVHSGFNDQLSVTLLPGYKKPIIAIYDVRCSYVFKCR